MAISSADIRAGRLYDLCLNLPGLKERKLFGLVDCGYRWILVVATFYWAAFTRPLDFFVYTMRYNRVGYFLKSKEKIKIFFLISKLSK